MKIFENLEIKKCLHGKLPNNEGENALIWKSCPKDIYTGLTVLEIGPTQQWLILSVILFFNYKFTLKSVFSKCC